MIAGLGLDLVEVGRIVALARRHPGRFVRRCFREPDPAADPAALDPEHLAERWALKEAFLKAVGGTVAHIPYRDIEVRPAAGGGHTLIPHGAALDALQRTGADRLSASATRQGNYVLGLVLLQRGEGGPGEGGPGEGGLGWRKMV